MDYFDKKFMTKLIIVSFSSGLDSAIIKVIATRALLEIIGVPSMIRWLFLFKNSSLRTQEKWLHQFVCNHRQMDDL